MFWSLPMIRFHIRAALSKTCLRAAKTQISLHVRAVWSGSLLSAVRSIGYYRSMNGEQRPDDTSACADDLRTLCMFKGIIIIIFFFCWTFPILSQLPFTVHLLPSGLAPMLTSRQALAGVSACCVSQENDACSLIHLCRMDSSALTLCTCPFPMKGVSG